MGMMNGDPGKKPLNGRSAGDEQGDQSRKGGYRDYDPDKDEFDEDFNEGGPDFLDDDFDEFSEEDDDYDDDFEDGLFDEDEDELRGEESGVPRRRTRPTAAERMTARLPRARGSGKRTRRMLFLSSEAARLRPVPVFIRPIHPHSRLNLVRNHRAAHHHPLR